MDILPSGNIFRELQDIHDTGYFTAQPSLEDHWQQELGDEVLQAVDISHPALEKHQRLAE
ncbi:Krueppel-like factor 6 isoform X2 [Nilaparvata lugens]|uniref:Krueppel-like factor 6 isoform X2 n=1 Tax=Nilaparvata lugens TaxID=108931 RepID=UPI00193D59D7|nr:Krueppel-like factor 6 isoform X2 [Nilaparvata lugens]XP_039287222.1 Krueppel-like factor 6 isoform X2 [Nilaparvata lugens]